MEKENNNKNSNRNTIIIAIVAVALIAAITAGGTYAYWTWRSNTAQITNIIQDGSSNSFVIAKPGLTITGNNATGKIIAPTATCYNSNYTLAGRATVEANNNTGIASTVTLKVKAKVVLSQSFSSTTERDNALTHLHFAIKKVNAADTAFSASNCTGTNGAEFYTATFPSSTVVASNANPVEYSTAVITYDVPANTSYTYYYQVYVWLDSGYTHENVGNVQSDPFQDMTVLLSFSETSTLAQKTT